MIFSQQHILKYFTGFFVLFFVFSLNAQPCIAKLDNMNNSRHNLPSAWLPDYIECVNELAGEVTGIKSIGKAISNLSAKINAKKVEIKSANESKEILNLQNEITELENTIADLVNNKEISNLRAQQNNKRRQIETLKGSNNLERLNKGLAELEKELATLRTQKQKIGTLDRSYAALIRYYNEDEDGITADRYTKLKTELQKSF